MLDNLGSKLTYANVMATVAVFLALGGGAIAAKALKKNSVGSKQLKAGAVKTADIANNAVTNPKIAGNAVDGSKIKDGSVGIADAAQLAAPEVRPSGTVYVIGTCLDSAAGGGSSRRHLHRCRAVVRGQGRAPGSRGRAQLHGHRRARNHPVQQPAVLVGARGDRRFQRHGRDRHRGDRWKATESATTAASAAHSSRSADGGADGEAYVGPGDPLGCPGRRRRPYL